MYVMKENTKYIVENIQCRVALSVINFVSSCFNMKANALHPLENNGHHIGPFVATYVQFCLERRHFRDR